MTTPPALAGTHPALADHAETLAAWRAEHGRLAGWLDALGRFGDQAPPQVVARVRDDYAARLAELARRAATRVEELASALEAARRAAAAATEGRLELRLRYLIGEVDATALDAGLDEREAVLAAATAAQPGLAAARAEVEAFLGELESDTHATPAPPAGAAGPPADDALSFLRELPASEPPALSPPGDQPGERLACAHCGALNDPRHWYCDDCGAELA